MINNSKIYKMNNKNNLMNNKYYVQKMNKNKKEFKCKWENRINYNFKIKLNIHLNKFLDKNIKIIKGLKILKQVNGIIYKIYLNNMIKYIHLNIIIKLKLMYQFKIHKKDLHIPDFMFLLH
jgi:hypothetical protein